MLFTSKNYVILKHTDKGVKIFVNFESDADHLKVAEAYHQNEIIPTYKKIEYLEGLLEIKSLSIFKQKGIPRNKCHVNLNTGIVYVSQDDFPKANFPAFRKNCKCVYLR